MNEAIKNRIIEIVGDGNFTDSLIDMIAYSYDASDHNHRPDMAIWPMSAQQISEILKIANSERIPVIPRGAGTGLAGGAVPIKGGLVLDLCRMNRIIDIRIQDRAVILQPGVVYADLQKALDPHGFFFPPDPASGNTCTIGGNVATNAGGLRGAKYGVTRDYVLGLEVVLPDGRIINTGGRFIKSSSGYDLTRLFVGSEGTLGIITEITLKIHPKPLSFKTALALFASLEDSGRAVTEIMQSGIIPSALEILDENTIQILIQEGIIEETASKAMILAETDGYTHEESEFQMERLIRAFENNNASVIRLASSRDEADQLWRVRRSISSLSARIRPNNVSEDIGVPISRVPELLTGISEIVKRYGFPFVIFGHAGDGNLHPKIMFDGSDPGQRSRLKMAVDEIFQLACTLNGTLTGEHGIGLAKAPFMELEHESVTMDVMRSIKRLFDPNNILNPGKMAL